MDNKSHATEHNFEHFIWLSTLSYAFGQCYRYMLTNEKSSIILPDSQGLRKEVGGPMTKMPGKEECG